ncbi:MAG: hypothetical protein J6T22_06440 [Bacteroidales bacterium]|nr:hypothetical protein [Bacteroidales bacterium]
MAKLKQSLKRQIQETVPFWIIRNRRNMYDEQKLKQYIVDHYGEERLTRAFIRDMRNAFLFRGVKYKEFFKMKFEEKTKKERKQFVPRCEELALYYQVDPRDKFRMLLEDKYQCYNFFKSYYKRGIIKVNPIDTIHSSQLLESVLGFINSSKSGVMLKPYDSSGGQGITIINPPIQEKDLMEICANFSKEFVLEELIIQNEEMGAFHPRSVNSIRVVSVNYGNEIEVKWPFFRMGRGDSIVDNAAQGGVFAAIDVFTGKTFAAGDEHSNIVSVHPDSKKSLIGFQIPKWDQLCQLVKILAGKIPDCRILGWDMALTDQGWVVVECNYGPHLVYQYIAGSIRKEFEEVRSRLGAKKYGGYYKRWQFKP